MRSGAILVVFTLASGLIAIAEACGGSSDVTIHVDGGSSPQSSPQGSGVGSSGARGTSSSSSSSSSSSGGPGNEGGPDAPPPPDAGPDVVTTGPNACPSTAPVKGTGCPGPRDCTYGTDPRFGCRTTATCTDGGTWVVTEQGCGPAPTCPADPPATLVACTAGEICGYPDETCTCSSPCDLPVCPAAAPIVAPTFQCSKPPAGCPSSPPNLGTSCGAEGTSCNYNACAGGVSMKCADGVWKRNPVLCPG